MPVKANKRWISVYMARRVFVTRGFIIVIGRDKWRRKCANNGGAKCVAGVFYKVINQC